MGNRSLIRIAIRRCIASWPSAFVLDHGVIELKRLDGIAVLELVLYDGVQGNMQEGINFALRIELSISHDIGKFKLIKKLIRVLEHDLAESLLFLAQSSSFSSWAHRQMR